MIQVSTSDTGMILHDLLLDDAFLQRPKNERTPERESIALRRLARVFAECPERVLQELVDVAVEFCGADSAGISLEERGETGEKRFRWIVVSGSFAKYLNGTTPRNYSPCGTCLDRGRPQYYQVTQPYYDFLGVTADAINDGLLIPWKSENLQGTLWAVSHRAGETFDINDYNVLQSLADFAAIALRHQYHQRALRKEENLAASAAQAHQMAHRINNPLQSLINTIYLARQDGEETQTYLKLAADELELLSEVVRNLLSVTRVNDK